MSSGYVEEKRLDGAPLCSQAAASLARALIAYGAVRSGGVVVDRAVVHRALAEAGVHGPVRTQAGAEADLLDAAWAVVEHWGAACGVEVRCGGGGADAC